MGSNSVQWGSIPQLPANAPVAQWKSTRFLPDRLKVQILPGAPHGLVRIWVCGLTVYEMYEGSIPFRAATEGNLSWCSTRFAKPLVLKGIGFNSLAFLQLAGLKYYHYEA